MPPPPAVSAPRRSLLRQARDVARAAPWFVAAPLARSWHLRWGATDEEVAAPMPGDDVLPDAQYTATRAVTVAAEPGEVWPWLMQVGHGRAGFYSLDLLDNLGRPSADRVVPELQDVVVGDWVPMSPTLSVHTAFRVTGMAPEQWLLWGKPDSTWSWQLAPVGGGTRVVTRLRARYDRRRPAQALLSAALMELGDFAMMRAMLVGLRERAEALHAARAARPA